jgi:FkbM family methyltransferase
MVLSTKTKFLNFFRQLFFLPVLEKILLSLNQGKEYDNFFSKFIPNHYQYKANSLRIVERNHVKYCLDLSDLVDWYMYYDFKDNSKQTLFALAKQGDYIIDIGANVGEISFNLAKKVGKNGKIISFEPDKYNFDRLLRNYKLNTFDNIQLVNKGLGNKPGRYLMRINENEVGNNGSKRIVASVSGSNDNSIDVIALDTYFQENPVSKIALIKMDVEGYEVNVLNSASKTIQNHRPIIYTEMQDKKLKEFGSSASEMTALIKNKGYKVLNAETNEAISDSYNFTDCHIDILCIPIV